MTYLSPCPPEVGAVASPDFEHDVLALQPALLAFARRLAKQESDAEDLVQDTILKALAARHRFQKGTNLRAWLFTILRNRFCSRWRMSRREVVTGPEMIDLGGSTPATQETLLWASQAAEQLLFHLSPAHRDVILLVPVRGASYAEAAQILGCSEGTVKSRLNRARAVLAALVEGKAA